MTSLVQGASLGSPITLAGGGLTAAVVVVATDPAVGALVWASWSEGPGPARAALTTTGMGPAVLATLGPLVVVVVLGLMAAAAAERAAPGRDDDDAASDFRRADRSANRLSGALVAVAGAWLLAGGGGVGPGLVLGAVALAAGGLLLARPDEPRSGYRLVAGTLRPEPGAAGMAADPLFRTWSEGVRRRMGKEPEPDPAPKPGPKPGSRRAPPETPAVVDGVNDPWAVLGLSPDTPLVQVTRRWKRLCKRYHPDVVPRGLQAETLEAVKKINAAYQVIRETLRRRGEA